MLIAYKFNSGNIVLLNKNEIEVVYMNTSYQVVIQFKSGKNFTSGLHDNRTDAQEIIMNIYKLLENI